MSDEIDNDKAINLPASAQCTILPDAQPTAQQPELGSHTPNSATVPPSFSAAPSYGAAPAEVPRKVRRVGILTMGVSLIVAGVVVLISLFYPGFDFVTAAKLSPLVLVFVGLEILYHNFFHHSNKLKYDFLSAFVCFMLISASISVAILPPLYEQYGPRRSAVQHSIENEIEALSLSALTGLPISSFHSNVSISRPINNAQEFTSQNLIANDYVNIDMELTGKYADEAQFANECKIILDKLANAKIPFSSLHVEYDTGKDGLHYWLDIQDRFRAALSADKLAQVVGNNKAELAEQTALAELARQREELNADRQRQREELESQREELNADMQRQREELESQGEELELERRSAAA